MGQLMSNVIHIEEFKKVRIKNKRPNKISCKENVKKSELELDFKAIIRLLEEIKRQAEL
jgi:hypothetical protein